MSDDTTRSGGEGVLTASMSNDDAYALGFVASAAGHPGRSGVGDSIDRGLILVRLLREYGYGVTRLPEGRIATSPVHDLRPPLIDVWPGQCAYIAISADDGRSALASKGWTPPPVPSSNATTT